MWIENILYFVTFILSAGMSALGILISYQLYQQYKKQALSALLYQQIFLFSFLIYSVWGNIVLRIILSDIQLSEAIHAKLAVFIPMIGLPFMVVSWFMLLKLGLKLNGFNTSKAFAYIYFPTLVVLVITLDILIHKNIIRIPNDPDLFIIRILMGINLVIHLVFVLIFFAGHKKLVKESGFGKREALQYLGLVVLYTFALSFFNYFEHISTCISIALLFAASTFVPFIIRLKNQYKVAEDENMNFEEFCETYEISKREAEIVVEICSGKTNKAIAEKLFITLQTVKDHNHRIFTKTGVKSRVQLTNLVREKTGQ